MTAPAVRLEPVSLADKPALWDMMAPYLIEHADKVDPAREHGDPLQYDYFDVYWTEPERHPYWIVAAGERAGFVLVNAWSPSGRGTQHSIGEFCVTPAARRGGLGGAAVRLALASAPGLWELQVYRANPEGMAFWPRAIAAAGAADWEVIESEDRVIHRFTIAA
jgi:predicted acetyltransferase